MAVIGIFEAKERLSELLERVERGEQITITKRGRPVALLVPPEQSAEDLVEWFRRARQGVRLGGLSIRELIDEGRR